MVQYFRLSLCRTLGKVWQNTPLGLISYSTVLEIKPNWINKVECIELSLDELMLIWRGRNGIIIIKNVGYFGCSLEVCHLGCFKIAI